MLKKQKIGSKIRMMKDMYQARYGESVIINKIPCTVLKSNAK